MPTLPAKISPMPIWQSILFAALPAALAYFAMWFLAPTFAEWTGQPYLVGYLLSWGSCEILIFFAAILAFRLEGHAIDSRVFRERYRLNPPNKGDLVWALATVVLMVATYLALSFTSRWLASYPAFTPHPAFPPELRPGAEQDIVPGLFMGMQLKGRWWVLLVYLVGWAFNIAGEELWFRGFMLPRQEVTHGRLAWLANGLCFNFFHVMWKWNLIALFPGSLILSFVAQQRKTTWVALVAHGLLNITTALTIAAGVLGWGAT
jgi:membrane protease YdiL (CAAX protease family)